MMDFLLVGGGARIPKGLSDRAAGRDEKEIGDRVK